MNKKPFIVIIEDNQDDYEAIIRVFKKNFPDNNHIWFKDSKKALEYINSLIATDNMPAFILLDLNMPGIDGREMLVHIKNKTKQIPVIISTTSSAKKDILQCYHNGANSYIQKPVNFTQLEEVLLATTKYWLEINISANEQI